VGGKAAVQPKEQTRIIDVEERYFFVRLIGGPLNPGEQVTVRCQLSILRATDPLAATAPAQIDRGERQVAFVCHVKGFRLLSAQKIIVDIKPEGDTDDVLFLLEVAKAEARRITITAYQVGIVRGQVVIGDPARYLPARSVSPFISTDSNTTAPDAVGALRLPKLVPSLSLDLFSPTTCIIANSPIDKLNWSTQTLSNWRGAPGQVLEMVGEHVKGLYNKVELDVEDEFVNALGPEIAKVMPKELVEALADPRVTDLMIQVPADFDFPIELATISATRSY
jgi:hypothetical protein